MKRHIVCLITLVSIALYGHTQLTRYIIHLKDKGNNPYSLANPVPYLSQKSIDRRLRYNIAIDSTDLPVTPAYVDSIRSAGAVTILNISKWLNSVSIQTTDMAALSKINSFSFVSKNEPIASKIMSSFLNSDKFFLENKSQTPTHFKEMGSNGSYYNYGLSSAQVNIHNGSFLHDIGLRGQTMTIGMLDAGYRNYTSLHAFDSVNINNQVLGVFDFVAHDSSVVEDNPHGMECFSTMAANIPGQFVG
ncbi:MAG TPA: hypothetical protein VGO09_07930, partial [Flavisolibacter sp.]|nr:hypothetical protein [Flavisolibacter sp.]